jgi:6-phosphogluconolactonase
MFQFQLHVDNNEEGLAQACAQEVSSGLRQAIASQGQAYLALSGGKSPLSFLRHLFKQALDWSLVTLVPVDERWVPVDHADSNEGLIRRELSSGNATMASCISLYEPGLGSAHHAEPGIESRLTSLLPERLDIAVVGMGEDGHTASWFAQSPQIEACLSTFKRCLAVDPVTAEYERMTLSAHYILQSRQLFLYAPGAKKIATLALALQQQNTSQFPVTKLFQHPHLHWWTSASA